MKKVLTVCIMLAALVFLAFASSNTAKQAKENARSVANETVKSEAQKTAGVVDAPVLTKADGTPIDTRVIMGPYDPANVKPYIPVTSFEEEVVLLKADGSKPNMAINFENLGHAPAPVAYTEEPNAEIKAAYEAGDFAAYKELLASETTARGPARSLDQGGETCADAVAITALPFCDEGTTVGAVDDFTTPCAYSSGAPDVVYSYTPAADETVIVTLSGSGFDTQLYIVTDCADVATYVACDDDGGTGLQSCTDNVALTANTTYYIIIDGYSSSSGTYILKADVVGGAYVCTDATDCSGPPPVPANDLCADAEALTLPASVTGTNVGGTDDITPYCGTGSPNQAVWYSVVGDGNTLTATTCNAGTDFDTKIQVFTGCCDALQCVTGNDDGCIDYSGLLSTATWCSEVGRTYLIAVGGYGSGEGAIQLDVTSDDVPCDLPNSGDCLVDFSFTAPFTNSSTTCGACNNCDLRGSEDHVYEVYIPQDGEYTFSLCGSSFDTYMFLGDACCTSFIANDDAAWDGSSPCAGSLQSELTCVTLTAGTYYVTVEGYSSYDCGDYTLDVSGPCTPPPLGRCCYGDIGAPTCEMLTELDCGALSGSWDEFLTCDDPCPVISCEAGPVADFCQDAIPIAPGERLVGSTVGMTPETLGYCGTSDGTGGAVWYTFIGTGTHVELTTCDPCTDFDTKIRVFACSCENLFCIGGNDDYTCSETSQFGTSRYGFCTVAGQQYWVVVYGYGSNEGLFALKLDEVGDCIGDPLGCPCWDETLTADATTPVSTSGSTVGAGNDCDLETSEDWIVQVNIPSDGDWKFSLCGSGFDTRIYVGTDCCLGDLCYNDDAECDGSFTLQSECCITGLVAGTYYVAIEGYSGAVGDFTLTVETCLPPQGRCCYEDDLGRPACDVTDEPTCLALSGTWAFGLDCSEPCPVGRCCYGDPEAPSCADNWEYQCNALGGSWDASLACGTDPCPSLVGENCDYPVDAIAALPYSDSGSTVGKNNDYDAACPWSGNAGDVAYHFTPDTDLDATLDLCLSGYDTKLYVYDVTNVGVGPGLEIACNDDATPCPGSTGSYRSRIECLPLFANTLYCIIVDGYGGDEGDYTLRVEECVPCLPIPENDQCADLVDSPIVTPGSPVVATGNNECATDINDCPGLGAVVWESFTTTEECGIYTLAYCGSEGNPNGYVNIWSDCECLDAYAGIPPFDNTSCGDGNYTVTYMLPAGTYYVAIHPDLTPNYTLTVTWIDNCPEPYICESCPELNSHSADPDPDLPISNLLDPTCLTINVPIEYGITDVNVSLDITHTWDSDLTITLQSPAGTIVTLASGNGGSGDNFFYTVFDDEAPTSIAAGAAPFDDCFYPVGLLSDFDGENAVGDWILCITDCCNFDDGTLNWACLTFEYDEILPVALNGFDAIAGDRSITLTWETASETNNDHFNILRNSERVGSINAENSATGSNYRFVDEGLVNGTTYDYTVVSVSVSGATEEVFTISATPSMTAATITEYALHQNFPNPFNPGTSITFDLVDAGFVNLKVYNLLGQEVAALVSGTMDAGRHIVNFQADNLPSGLYLYRLEVNGFSAQKKMVLMK